jgi:hypothetical protein
MATLREIDQQKVNQVIRSAGQGISVKQIQGQFGLSRFDAWRAIRRSGAVEIARTIYAIRQVIAYDIAGKWYYCIKTGPTITHSSSEPFNSMGLAMVAGEKYLHKMSHLNTVLRLHLDGKLSEGEVCKRLNVSRLKLRDAMIARYGSEEF